MDEIRIPNGATYAPVALTDLMAGAPLASRLLLGATLPGRVVSLAAFGLYAGNALRDWSVRRGVRQVDFFGEFGADVDALEPTPRDVRLEEIAHLAARLESLDPAEAPPRGELARRVNTRLTTFIAGVTDQRVVTSDRVRDFTLAKVVFPFAMGVCDFISGDIAVFRELGVIEPHVLAHEFTHRKGYFKELHAQALAYLALASSDDPVLVRAALFERLHRQLKVLADRDFRAYHDLVDGLELEPGLDRSLRALRPDPAAYGSAVSDLLRTVYDQRLKLTGQNGISDYDRGFTDFLWTFERSTSARQDPGLARI